MCVFVYRCIVLCVVLMRVADCNPVMTNFNASVRDFSNPEDNINSTSVRTLQKEELARYANFAPVQSPIKFKEIPDNALSSTAHHGRGLLHHEHNGYGLDYDDGLHYGHGDYHLHDAGHLLDHHHDSHGYAHHLGYHSHGHGSHHDDDGHHDTHLYHGDHGHNHHKHLAHALAAKTIFWPIAGIALLGAAAALVSNPVLLQLGVVSGRRKRETQDTTDFAQNSLTKWMNNNPFVVTAKTSSLKRTDNNFKVKPIDNYQRNTKDDIENYKRQEGVERKDDISRRHLRNRVFDKKRVVLRKPSAASANAVYVNQDLPRTETDENKHYIAIPLLTNS